MTVELQNALANPIQFRLLLVEDELDVLDQMEDGFRPKLLKALDEIELEQEGHEETRVPVAFAIRKTDNFLEANTWCRNGHADLMLADCRIKKDKASKKNTADIRPLLEAIKNRKAFIPVIGHTAYSDFVEPLTNEKLVYDILKKTSIDSTSHLIDKGVDIALEMIRFRRGLRAHFSDLVQALTAEDIIARQDHLRSARRGFSELSVSTFAPRDYRKTVVMITSLLHRVSTVPSPKLGIPAIGIDFVERLFPLIDSLSGPFHEYTRITAPVLMELEARGYDVLPRFDNE